MQIESFSLREIFTITGQPGLWKIKSVSRPYAVLAKLTNPAQTLRVNIANISAVESMRIATTTPLRQSSNPHFSDPRTTVSTIFERLYDRRQAGITSDTMMELVPDADTTQFFQSHFSKILKWYADLELAMTMLPPEEEIVVNDGQDNP